MSPIVASYSICNLGFDPIKVLQGLVWSSPDGLTVTPLGAIADRLREGWRFGFPVSRSIDNHLDSHSGALRVSGIWSCVVLKNGSFNKATLSDGAPSNPNSLIGVVHRALLAAGEHPTWSRVPDAYSNTLLGPGDLLEVSL